MRFYKFYSVSIKSKKEIDKKYKFRMYFLFIIPMILINDWNHVGFMIKEFKFFGFTIYKQKKETVQWIPNSLKY